MIREFGKYLFYFVVLILAQLLIFNNIEFSGYVNPYVYVLFILLLPFTTPRIVLLISAFALGLIIDLFMGTPGVHSSATVLMAFSRSSVMALFSPREGYQSGTYPRLAEFGLEWFVKYTVMLVLIHHFALFYLEVFSFHHFFSTLFRAFLSSVLTSLIIIFSQYFVFRK
ncbi:MAG: rod shape-determining protein MreD [Bacteroidales bacterium]|nr:rod shape-determining protein MreD [Bacteroidales bacterium]